MNQFFDQPIPPRIGMEVEKWDLMDQHLSPDIVPLSVADMEFRSPPAIVQALEEMARSGLWGYAGWGDRYYNAIRSWVSRRYGWEVQREWIIRTTGVVHGINAAVRAFTSPGDGIVIQTPVYPPFYRAVRENGRTLLENPLKLVDGHYQMDFDDLEDKLSRPTTTAMILCSPHNPVGRVWTRAELQRVGDLCLAHGVFMISDEIHCDLCQPDHPHTVYASLGEAYAQQCVIGMAASKTFSLAGLACGNMIVPDGANQAKLAAEVARSGAYSNSSFGTLALEVGYEQCEPWLNDLLAYLRGNYQYLKDFLARHFPQVWVAPLEGTYLAWMDFSALGLDDKALARFLEQEAKLYLSHGINYGGPGFMRLNLACSRAVLTAALDRLLSAAQRRGLA